MRYCDSCDRAVAPVRSRAFWHDLTDYGGKMDVLPSLQHQLQRGLEQVTSALTSVQEVSGLTPAQLLIVGVAGLVSLLLLYNVLAGIVSAACIPRLDVTATEAESNDVISAIKFDPKKPGVDKDVVPCYDPGTMQLLGYVPAMSAQEVKSIISRSKVAAEQWRTSSFSQRRRLLKILLKFIIDNQETICRVAARDAGKAMLDAIMGEVIVTCEKIYWLCREGEKWLKPDYRSVGIMSFYKRACVEFVPVGVVGAIVPWNYPFHNVLNPLTAALFAGNSLVIKVSEHASWSTGYYNRFIQAALAAAGAPADLVQFVTGYGEAGNALVTGGVNKVIFVGSTAVGRKVMAAAAETLTPVVLELGGKDPFVFCEDVNLDEAVQVALKGAYLNMGQNCAGGERFFVHTKIYDKFAAKVVEVVSRMRQGPALGHGMVDCGAMCMAGADVKIQELVDDAVAQGAKLLAGGQLPTDMPGQFYPPTVLSGVKPGMKIWKEEVFGPVMSLIPWTTEDEVVELANKCDFGLGSSVFSGSQARARRIINRIEAGMASVNDFASTYMCQSVPFGGVKHSGFDRFAGIEGLRGLCVPKSVAEDRVPWLMRTNIPPVWHYPVKDVAFPFATGLVTMFYGPGLLYKIKGVMRVLACFLMPSTVLGKKNKNA